MTPYYVTILSKLIPILKTEGNLAKGEIEKFHYVDSQKNTHKFNKRVTSSDASFSYIWSHISNDYFKCIGKWIE